MAVDYQENIKKLSVLDIVPTSHVFDNTSALLARRYYHWFFLIQSFPHPETMIGKDPEYYIRSKLKMWGANNDYLTEDIINEYLRSFTPETIHASCEDYRAGQVLTYHLKKMKEKNNIYFRFMGSSDNGGIIQPIKVWKDWADDVEGESIDCGHFLPEENP